MQYWKEINQKIGPDFIQKISFLIFSVSTFDTTANKYSSLMICIKFCLKDVMHHLLIQSRGIGRLFVSIQRYHQLYLSINFTTRTGKTNYIQFNSRPCTVISNPISKDDMFDFLMELEYTRRSNRIQMRSPPTIYDSPKNAQRIKIPK